MLEVIIISLLIGLAVGFYSATLVVNWIDKNTKSNENKKQRK